MVASTNAIHAFLKYFKGSGLRKLSKFKKMTKSI